MYRECSILKNVTKNEYCRVLYGVLSMHKVYSIDSLNNQGLLNYGLKRPFRSSQSLAGLVSSARGPKGGFVLKRSAWEISLLEVFEAIEGRLEETRECLLGQPICHGGRCIFGNLLKQVDQQARKYFSRNMLSDLVSVFEG